jgi:protein O-mannosyl-transferase
MTDHEISKDGPQKLFGMNERLRIALLLTVAILVYVNTLVNEFALDDYLYIFNNPAVMNPSFHGLFSATKDFNVFRPLTFAALALNWAVGEAHAWGYHLVNLLLHAAVTLLLYFVFRKLLEALPEGTVVAWVAALLFAVHPIHTEAVASIVGRSELLAVGFLLSAWLLHLRGQIILALLCFVLAMLAKESAIVFLPLVVAGDYARGKLKPLLQYVWFGVVGMLYMVSLWKMQGGRFGERGVNFLDNPFAHFPASLRILNAVRIGWKYIGLHIFPATLSCDYSYNAILLYSNWQHLLFPALAAAALLAIWIWAILTRQREWALAGAIYLIGFAVTANILLPTGTIMGERLAYLPSAGFCLLVALLWVRLEKRQGKLAWTVLSVAVIALAAGTVVRNRDWQNNFTLFSSAVQAVPGSARAHAGLGGEYLRRDELEAAGKEYQIALDIYPDFGGVMNSYGLVQSRLGHNDEAVELFRKSLARTRKDDPKYNTVASNLAEQLIKIGKSDEALRLLDRQLSTSPEDSRTWSIRAVIWYQRGDWTSARADARTALRFDPSNTQAHDLIERLDKSNSPAPQL